MQTDKNEGKAYIHVGYLSVAIKRNKIGKGKWEANIIQGL